MNPTLFVSRKLVSDFREKLAGILARAPRKLDVLEFTPDVKLTPEQHASIEATFYSRDIWEGTIKTRLSDAATVYWPIVDSAPNLKWLQVVSAGSDQKPYQPSIKRGLRVATSAGANAGPVGLTAVTGLLMLARNFPHWLRAQQKREWSPQLGANSPLDLPGQTAAIVGMGHIGKVIARAAWDGRAHHRRAPQRCARRKFRRRAAAVGARCAAAGLRLADSRVPAIRRHAGPHR